MVSGRTPHPNGRKRADAETTAYPGPRDHPQHRSVASDVSARRQRAQSGPALPGDGRGGSELRGGATPFLQGRFVGDARDCELNWKNLQTLKNRYRNTLTTTLWHAVEERDPDVPILGLISRHPRHPSIGGGADGANVRYFIRSRAFKKVFPHVTGDEVYTIVVGTFISRSAGPAEKDPNPLVRRNGVDTWEFQFQSFCNSYDLLNLCHRVKAAIASCQRLEGRSSARSNLSRSKRLGRRSDPLLLRCLDTRGPDVSVSVAKSLPGVFTKREFFNNCVQIVRGFKSTDFDSGIFRDVTYLPACHCQPCHTVERRTSLWAPAP